MGAHMRKPVRSLALLSVAAVAARDWEPPAVRRRRKRAAPVSRSWRRASRRRSAWRSRRTARPTCRPTMPACSGTSSRARRPRWSTSRTRRTPRSAACPSTGNTVTFTITGKNKMVKQMHNGGQAHDLADVGKYEATKNPDKGIDLRPAGRHRRLRRAVAGQAGRARRRTTASSTPTPTPPTRPLTASTSATPRATTSCWVGNDGKIKTVAVLPPTPVTITGRRRRGLRAARLHGRA